MDDGAEVEEPAETDCMNQQDARHFLKVARKHFGGSYPIFLAALRTAARQGELVALPWDAVDWNGNFVTIEQTATNGGIHSTKNRQLRRVPMTPQLADALKEHRRRAGEAALAAGKPMAPWVFPSPAGGLLDPSKLLKEFKVALSKAKIRDLAFHSLRHSALTAMAEGGVPMAALQRIAGHSSIQVTGRYYLHVEHEAHQGAIRAMAALDDAVPARESGGHAKTTRMGAETRTGNEVHEVGQEAEIAG